MKFSAVVEREGWIDVLDVDGQVLVSFEKVKAELPKGRAKRTLNGRKRWLGRRSGGTLLTGQQGADEDYQTEMRIA